MVNSFPLTMKLISSQADLLQITFSAFPQSLWTQLSERNFHLFSSCTLLDCVPLCPFLGFERVTTFHTETVSEHLMVVNRTHKRCSLCSPSYYDMKCSNILLSLFLTFGGWIEVMSGLLWTYSFFSSPTHRKAPGIKEEEWFYHLEEMRSQKIHTEGIRS